MRTPQRRLDPGIVADSLERPERYEFFQLVRLYEQIFSANDGSSSGEAVGDRICFRNSLRLGFAPSQVDAIRAAFPDVPDDAPGAVPQGVEITPSFMGMLGIHGALPIHYTERVIHHERFQRDESGRAFLDLFSNRSLTHFYNAWKKYRLPVQYEGDRKQRFLPLLLALSGLGFSGLRQRMSDGEGAVDDESMAYFAGLLRQKPLSAEALKRVLTAYFREKVVVEQFVGHWYVVPIAQRSSLGGANACLGRTALAGERVWQRNLRIRIQIGPLRRQRYLDFLPRGQLSIALQKLLSLATGAQFEYEICPILRAEDVHPACLRGRDAPQLGYDAFLKTRPEACDRRDTRYLAQFTQ